MSQPRDFHHPHDDFPYNRSKGNSHAYVDPDYVATETKDQLPLVSTMGAGPPGEGVYAMITDEGEDSFRFGIYSDKTGEQVLESPNLHGGLISITQPEGEPISGEVAHMDVHISRDGVTETYTLLLPPGSIGSYFFAVNETKKRMKTDTYQFAIPELGYKGTMNPPRPRVNDCVFFTTYDAEKKLGYLSVGNIESVTGGNVIVSCRFYYTTPAASWGNIIGMLENQTDLWEFLQALVAQDNILQENIDEEARRREEHDDYLEEKIEDGDKELDDKITALRQKHNQEVDELHSRIYDEEQIREATDTAFDERLTADEVLIAENQTEIAALKGANMRFPTSEALPETLTQAELNSIWDTASKGKTLVEGDTLVSSHTSTRNYTWTYFGSTQEWIFRGVDTATIATNEMLGLVKGTANTPGKASVSPDGSINIPLPETATNSSLGVVKGSLDPKKMSVNADGTFNLPTAEQVWYDENTTVKDQLDDNFVSSVNGGVAIPEDMIEIEYARIPSIQLVGDKATAQYLSALPAFKDVAFFYTEGTAGS